MGRVIAAFSQFFDGEGAPLALGWLRFTESGTNNTDKNTFYDPVYQIPNANPLQLDAEGRCPNVFGTGDYRVVLFENDPEDEDSPGEQIQLFDPVSAEAAASTGGGGASFEEWDAGTEYDLYDIVTYNTDYYRSLTATNLNNNPAIEESFWEKIDFLHYYNSTITYSAGALIQYNYNLYLSKQSLNSGNDPETSPSWWRSVATGYFNFYLKSTDYEILPTELDSVFILSAAATANSTFDLPAMDATTDNFKVTIYNASDYELTVSALTGGIWIDSTSDLILEKGASCEFRYSFDLDIWMPANNSGQALGGQTLGTITTPVSLIHATTANIVSANVENLYPVATHIASDDYLYFGDSDEASIMYNSVDTSLDINVAATNSIDFLIDDVLHWSVDPTGALIPGSVNPLKNIGSITDRINFIYPQNIYFPDNGVAFFGNGNDAYIVYNGTLTSFYASNGALNVGTINAANLNLVANGSTALTFDTAQNAYFYGVNFSLLGATQALNLGNLNLRVSHDTANGIIDTLVGSLYFRMTGSFINAMRIDTAGNVNFYQNTTIGTNEYHYMGDSNQARIGYAGFLLISTTDATQIAFQTNSSYRWQFISTGHLMPYSNITYDIGSAAVRVNNVYARYINTDRVRAPSNLTLEVQNGVGSGDDHNSMQITKITAGALGGSPAGLVYGGLTCIVNGTTYSILLWA